MAITITLAPTNIAFMKGMKAGEDAARRILDEIADGHDLENRRAFFWLSVGMAAAQEADLDLNDPVLQALYFQGAGLRVPGEPALPDAIIVGGVLMCGHDGCDARITTLVEPGYLRYWDVEYDAESESATALSKGYASYSDDGDGEGTLECARSHSNSDPLDGSDWNWS